MNFVVTFELRYLVNKALSEDYANDLNKIKIDRLQRVELSAKTGLLAKSRNLFLVSIFVYIYPPLTKD